MRPSGTIINLPSGLGENAKHAAEAKNLSVNYFMSVFPSGDDMREIAGMLRHRVVVPHISERFTLEQTATAREQVESGRTVGKVVIAL